MPYCEGGGGAYSSIARHLAPLAGAAGWEQRPGGPERPPSPSPAADRTPRGREGRTPNRTGEHPAGDREAREGCGPWARGGAQAPRPRARSGLAPLPPPPRAHARCGPLRGSERVLLLPPHPAAHALALTGASAEFLFECAFPINQSLAMHSLHASASLDNCGDVFLRF